ncbi:MAG: glycosyltransferase [Candidatus Marinimicrobia bacterium]|nr:glycosyltransferase [Candidatus Neomarinimicrobiota bacterium]
MNISVIIPSYNRASTLERAIQSVLDQTFPAMEIIVVDDASTDGTSEILKKYSNRIEIITNESNMGVSFSRNAGIQVAQSDWIAFLDSDDQWVAAKLEHQKGFHEAHPTVLISQCDEIWIRNGVRVNPMSKHKKKGGWIFESCIPLCIVSPSAVIIHRRVFEHIGLFDVNFLACEDYDLWLRIAPHYEIGLLDEKLVTRYGGHDDQLSRKYWGMDRFRITAMEKHVDSDLDPVWKKTLLEELQFKCAVVAAGAKKRDKLETAALYLEKQKRIQSRLNAQ